MIKEFTIGCRRTINLGNFENVRIEASVTFEVEERQNLERLGQEAQRQLRQLLEDTYRNQYAETRKPVNGKRETEYDKRNQSAGTAGNHQYP